MTLTPGEMAATFDSALPDTTSDFAVDGLDGRIDILRDSYGIPHVRAGTTRDAFFGQGFATAQDRLWHMDYDRARAYGRWAEHIGADGVEHDKTMRRFGIGASVEADWLSLSDDARAMFEAYADGVNAFIRSTRSLPVEYALAGSEPEEWRPQDSLAVFKVRHIMMGVFEGKLWRAKLVNTLGARRAASLLKGYQPGHLVIAPPGEEYEGEFLDGFQELERGLASVDWLKNEDGGSNSWAVHGSRTASGKPLVAGDPHRGLDTPNVYYQNHVACPDFDVIGLSFPGCPGFPHFGHNERVAWCVTHAGADYQDLYVEYLREGSAGVEYLYDGEWTPAETRRETISVRDDDDVSIDVIETEHGPVISQSGDGEKAIAFKYTATSGPNLGFECLLRMMLAQNADEIEESMRDWVDPCNNFVFADVDGEIGYLNRGQLPIRPMANAWLPVPGWTSVCEWRGVAPFERLARIRNPEEGLIVTANNRIAGEDYPYYIALDYAPEYRARRILERLRDLDSATVDDMAAIHAETTSIPAQVYTELILGAPQMQPAAEECRAELVNWDGRMDKGSSAALVYSAFRDCLHRRVFRHLLGPLFEQATSAEGRGAPSHIRQLSALLVSHARDGDVSMLPPGETWESIVMSSMRAAADQLRPMLSSPQTPFATWGGFHHTRPRHPLSQAFPNASSRLDPPRFPMSGDGDTPQAGSYSPTDPFVITGTSVARYVWDTADWDNSRWISPLGASGHPASRHYSDQAAIWADVRLVPALYSWERIEREAESSQAIAPVGVQIAAAPAADSPATADATSAAPAEGPAQTREFEGSAAEYGVAIRRNVMVEMRDGANMATDLYFPAIGETLATGEFPAILERTPYDKLAARQTTRGKFFARRGYVVAIQDVRGRFASEGEWHPFGEEAEDGFDTVEWLGAQEWCNGKVGTMGDSYAGSDQAALATLDPPSLATMIVAVGASNYFTSSMRHNGTLEQRFLIYCYRMATTSPEAKADPSLRAALLDIFQNGMSEVVESLPLLKGTTILRRTPSIEQWAIDIQTRGDYDDYWKQRGYAPAEYYEEHADAPTLYLGGWYDSYARNTTESYVQLSRLKKSDQRLLMGPWTHGQYEVTHAGDIDFGLSAHIDYNDLKLAWFDHYLKGMRTEVALWEPVRYFEMGGGDARVGDEHRLNHGGRWRQAEDWPPPGTSYTAHYIHADGSLSREHPTEDERPETSYVFDPSDPVPTIGGGISAAEPIMAPGAYDQRGDPSRFYGTQDRQPLNARHDVLTYQTPPLEADVTVTGPITVRLWAASSAVDTDFTAKLIDVYPESPEFPEGLAINITDSIVRARYRNGGDAPQLMEPYMVYEFEFELYPTSNVFAAGHRIRLDISSSNWPRFDVNHNTGAPLGVDRTYEAATQTVFHSPERASHIVLPIAPR